VNTGVEVTLIGKLQLELAEKKKRFEDMIQLKKSNPNSGNPSASITTLVSFRKKRKQEMEDRTEQRAITMVVLNAFINFFFRLPELLFIFSIFYKIFPGCVLFDYFFYVVPSLRLFTTNFTYFCYILTFSTNFFIYYLFNQKFKQTFSEWRHFKKRH
jgi:hypothetical protein